VGPRAIDRVVGVTKAYTTRVGAGPFVTELKDEIGMHLQNVGGEFGTTTGRARRCGWLDLVVVRHAVRLNGMTAMAVTKLDVLNDLETIKVCVAYEIDGERVENFPGNVSKVERAKPIYEELNGWKSWDGNTAELCKKGLAALPKGLRDYLEYISKGAGAPVGIVSVGKGRDETIDLRKTQWGRPVH
jgi:adenylosuccinate synthase